MNKYKIEIIMIIIIFTLEKTSSCWEFVWGIQG